MSPFNDKSFLWPNTFPTSMPSSPFGQHTGSPTLFSVIAILIVACVIISCVEKSAPPMDTTSSTTTTRDFRGDSPCPKRQVKHTTITMSSSNNTSSFWPNTFPTPTPSSTFWPTFPTSMPSSSFDGNAGPPTIFIVVAILFGACIVICCVARCFVGCKELHDDVAAPQPVQIISAIGSDNVYPNHIFNTETSYVAMAATPTATFDAPLAVVVVDAPSAPPMDPTTSTSTTSCPTSDW